MPRASCEGGAISGIDGCRCDNLSAAAGRTGMDDRSRPGHRSAIQVARGGEREARGGGAQRPSRHRGAHRGGFTSGAPARRGRGPSDPARTQGRCRDTVSRPCFTYSKRRSTTHPMREHTLRDAAEAHGANHRWYPNHLAPHGPLRDTRTPPRKKPSVNAPSRGRGTRRPAWRPRVHSWSWSATPGGPARASSAPHLAPVNPRRRAARRAAVAGDQGVTAAGAPAATLPAARSAAAGTPTTCRERRRSSSQRRSSAAANGRSSTTRQPSSRSSIDR